MYNTIKNTLKYYNLFVFLNHIIYYLLMRFVDCNFFTTTVLHMFSNKVKQFYTTRIDKIKIKYQIS